MLVLTRKVGQEIVIGGDIRLTLVAIDGGKVRIGVTAPPDVIVDREEIHKKRLNTDEWAEQGNRPLVAAVMSPFICKVLNKLPPIETPRSCSRSPLPGNQGRWVGVMAWVTATAAGPGSPPPWASEHGA